LQSERFCEQINRAVVETVKTPEATVDAVAPRRNKELFGGTAERAPSGYFRSDPKVKRKSSGESLSKTGFLERGDMSITAKYILMCDEVRQESNGKLIVLGLYTPDMAIPQLPFVVGSLTFFIALESDRPGNFQIRFALQNLDSGQNIAEGMGAVAFPKPGLGAMPIQLRNFGIPNAGTYVFSLTIEGQRDPITYSFNVILAPPQQVGMSPGLMQR